VDAIKARGILQLPLAGRLREAQVKSAYKRAAAEHHPDQGGEIVVMQRINAARDLLLSNEES
jgi:DnaJ-class molecular chaperone